MSDFFILGIGAIYEDVILTVPYFPHEDSKLRATSRKTRLGGNVPNMLRVLSQVIKDEWKSAFVGVMGDKESSSFLRRELEGRGILPWIFNRPDCGAAPTAYILEAAEGHTRTVVSYNMASDWSAEEVGRFIEGRIFKPHISWIHAEGRNCEELRKFLVLGTSPPATDGDRANSKIISIDFERPGREGLRELFHCVDVAFVSRNYANSIAMQENVDGSLHFTNEQMVRGFLREVGKELKETAVGYITVGSEGCYVFYAPATLLLAGSGYFENGWLFVHLPVLGRRGQVIETTGAGDTFIAAVIYGLGILKLDAVQAGELGNNVAGNKCLLEGYDDVWKGVEFPSRR